MSEREEGAMSIETVADLLAHALAMESEACERYGELAQQMEMCHNATVAGLFRRLEKVEKEHVAELEELCKDVRLPQLAPWEYSWKGGESPEAIEISRIHYGISARAAVELALEHERKAAEFYAEIATAGKADDVTRLAGQFADEEVEHVRWLEKWLAECGPESARGVDDPDPPNSLE
jgi:rubrerythrin